MTASQDDVEIGAAALKQYVLTFNELGFLVPWNDYEGGAEIVIDKWDELNPENDHSNVDAMATATAECGLALYKVISDAGYGGQIAPEQCAGGAQAVLNATREKEGKS